MLAARLAVATIFVCIGILLFSACGLPLGPPPRLRPQIPRGEFFLYTLGPQPRAIATGVLEGTTDTRDVRSSLTWLAPGCLKGQQVYLAGPLSTPTSASLALHSRSPGGPQVTLTATTAPTYRPTAIEVLPFAGTLTRSGSCADVSNLPVEARLSISLADTWRGSAAGFSITMSLCESMASPGGNYLSGTIVLSGPGGMWKAKLRQMVQLEADPGPLTLVFHQDSGETVTVLIPHPASTENAHSLEAAITVQGYAYGTLHAILSSPYPEE